MDHPASEDVRLVAARDATLPVPQASNSCQVVDTKALDTRADAFRDLPGPMIAKTQRLADAAVSIAQDSLDGYEPVEPSPRSDPVATVLIDAQSAVLHAVKRG